MLLHPGPAFVKGLHRMLPKRFDTRARVRYILWTAGRFHEHKTGNA